MFIFTVYNFSQDSALENNILYSQKKSLYLNDYNCNNIKKDRAKYINPKKHFVKSLQLLLENAKWKYQDILLTGDFNKDMGDNNNDLINLMLEIELIDVHAHTHGFEYVIATYIDGSCWLDYIFISRRIVDHVVCCGYETFCMHLVTNHRGYFVHLSLTGIFDRHLLLFFSPSVCHIRGNDPQNIRKYILAFFDYIETHKLLQMELELQHASNFDPKKAEKLDKPINNGMLTAGKKKCRIFYCLPLDKETHEVMMYKNIVKSLLSGMHQNIDLNEVLTLEMNKLKEPFYFPTIYADCNKLLISLQRCKRNLNKYWCANQATTAQACEQAFVAINKKKIGGTEKDKPIFAQKE